MSSTPPGEGCNCGPPGKRAKLGARDDPQPVVGGALVGLRLGYEIHALKILQYLNLFSTVFPFHAGSYLASVKRAAVWLVTHCISQKAKVTFHGKNVQNTVQAYILHSNLNSKKLAFFTSHDL